MKKYIVLTNQGFTENNYCVSTDNMQVLGWAEGINQADAIENFKKNYSKLLEGYGDVVILYELTNEPSKAVFIN